MIRVKDAEASLKFYQEALGLSLMRTHENEKAAFNLYFLGYPGTQGMPVQGQSTASREGLLELTWNYGTEKDEAFSYHDGNSADKEGRQGFGHLCKPVNHDDDVDRDSDKL
jgi:lactoylglutathione lyase